MFTRSVLVIRGKVEMDFIVLKILSVTLKKKASFLKKYVKNYKVLTSRIN